MKRVLTFAAVVFLFSFTGVISANTFALSLKDNAAVQWHTVMGPVTGNPVVQFNSDITQGDTVRDRFNSKPLWIVSGSFGDGAATGMAVLFEGGKLRYLTLAKTGIRTLSTTNGLSADSPPVITGQVNGWFGKGILCVDERGNLVIISPEDGRTRPLAGGFSKFSYPTLADLDGDGEKEILAVDEDGRFTVLTARNVTRTEKRTSLLPDARVAVGDLDADGRLEAVALTHPTSEFEFGHLGDSIEAVGFGVFTWDGKTVKLEDEFKLKSGQAFEDHTPLLADIAESDGLEVLLPVTKEGGGTRLRSFSFVSGRIRDVRSGPLSGTGKWLQPVAVGLMGDNQRPSVLSVTDPDTTGTLESYRPDLALTRIKLENEISTHIPGTRTVETVLLGDFNSDGQNELLAPSADRKSLNIVSLRKNRFRTWEVYNGTRNLSTNLAPGDYNGDGKNDVAAGFDDGSIIIILGK